MTRETLQIVEVDVPYCNLTYGTSPCPAALGGDYPRKCYNMRKSCQSPIHFGAPAEPTGGPDRSYDQGDTLTNADFAINADFFFAVDLSFPSGPSGCIMELGAFVTGLYLGVTSGNLVFRAGDGGTGHPSNCAKVSVDVSDYEGKIGTLYGAVDVSANSVALYWREAFVNEVVTLGTNAAVGAFPSGEWSGSQNGGLGTVVVTTCTDEDATDYSGTIYGARVFDSAIFEPVTPDNIKTLRYSKQQNGLPRSERVYPLLRSVSTNPAWVSLGGAGNETGPLGKRARVAIKLGDAQDSDIWLDKYQAERKSGTAQTDEGGYDPLSRGTHWGKMQARWPYYVGAAIRVLEGEVGQSISAMRARHYVVDEISGPGAGDSVTITAKDILDLADNDKAKCPSPSGGSLETDIDESGLPSFGLLPENIGAEYPSSGTARIGSEIVTYTRSGDTITITARALWGSEASSHDAGDTFQDCFVVENEPIADVAYDLLANYAGINTDFLPLTDWQTEAGVWLSGFNLTTVISEPTGVSKLMGELGDFGVMFYWDDVEQEIGFRANRPLNQGEVAASLSDNATFLERSLTVEDMTDKRISSIIFEHGVINYAESVSDSENYSRAYAVSSALPYSVQRYHVIRSRWLGLGGDDTIAQPVSQRMLSRFATTPKRLKFDCDAKDVSNLALGAPITVSTRVLQDETGLGSGVQMQVMSIEEKQAGHRLEVRAQSYSFTGRYGFITENTRTDYGSATAEEKLKGTYIVDDTLTFSDGSSAYIMF